MLAFGCNINFNIKYLTRTVNICNLRILLRENKV